MSFFVLANSFNSIDFTITNGIVDVIVDGKLKHLGLSVATTQLPQNIRIKEHE